MIKLAIVVGHSKKAPGASAVAPINDSEYSWNSDLAARMVTHVATLGDAAARVFFRDVGGIVGAYARAKKWGADAAMELHFNAAGETATGSETLYATKVSFPMAEAVQSATLATLGLKDRGVKTPQEASGGRGEKNLSQMGGKPSILTEPFFGSNAGDAKSAETNKQTLAERQVEAVINYLKSKDHDDTWAVSAHLLNVRGGPGVAYEKLAWGPLKGGTQVDVISWHGDWAMIETGDGKGFVHRAFLA